MKRLSAIILALAMTMSLSVSAVFVNSGTFTNAKSFTNTTTFTNSGGATFENSGTGAFFTNDGSGAAVNNHGTFNNRSGATFQNSGGLVSNSGGKFFNYGESKITGLDGSTSEDNGFFIVTDSTGGGGGSSDSLTATWVTSAPGVISWSSVSNADKITVVMQNTANSNRTTQTLNGDKTTLDLKQYLCDGQLSGSFTVTISALDASGSTIASASALSANRTIDTDKIAYTVSADATASAQTVTITTPNTTYVGYAWKYIYNADGDFNPGFSALPSFTVNTADNSLISGNSVNVVGIKSSTITETGIWAVTTTSDSEQIYNGTAFAESSGSDLPGNNGYSVSFSVSTTYRPLITVTAPSGAPSQFTVVLIGENGMTCYYYVPANTAYEMFQNSSGEFTQIYIYPSDAVITDVGTSETAALAGWELTQSVCYNADAFTIAAGTITATVQTNSDNTTTPHHYKFTGLDLNRYIYWISNSTNAKHVSESEFDDDVNWSNATLYALYADATNNTEIIFNVYCSTPYSLTVTGS